MLICRAESHGIPQDKNVLKGVSLIATTFAATVLLNAGNAHAGVVLQKTPLKKVFQDEPAAVSKSGKAAAKSSSGGSSVSLPSLPAISVGTVALPATVLGLVGAGFVVTKLDTGFGEFFSETVVKNSGEYAGYEEDLKSESGPKAAGKAVVKKAKTAAKEVKGAAKKIKFPFGN